MILNLDLKNIYLKNLSLLFNGFLITIFCAVLAFIISFIIGLLIAIFQTVSKDEEQKFIKIYISFFRGTPLLIQLFIFYYVLPKYIISLKSINKITALVFCMGMNYSAYLAEIFRGAIDSVPKSQWEAAKVFCMTDFQTIYRIILPQALIAALPSLGNSFMDLIKVSSIGMTIGVMDLMGRAQAIAATYYSVSEVYILAALMYWSISIILSKVQNKFESKIKKIY